MRFSRKVVALGVFAILVALTFCAYLVGRQMPVLVAPIAIEAATAFTDGGSVYVVLRDAENRRYGVGVDGRGVIEPGEFRVYVQPWPSLLPVPIYLPRGSKGEQALLSSLEGWRKQLAAAQSGSEMLESVISVLRKTKV